MNDWPPGSRTMTRPGSVMTLRPPSWTFVPLRRGNLPCGAVPGGRARRDRRQRLGGRRSGGNWRGDRRRRDGARAVRLRRQAVCPPRRGRRPAWRCGVDGARSRGVGAGGAGSAWPQAAPSWRRGWRVAGGGLAEPRAARLSAPACGRFGGWGAAGSAGVGVTGGDVRRFAWQRRAAVRRRCGARFVRRRRGRRGARVEPEVVRGRRRRRRGEPGRCGGGAVAAAAAVVSGGGRTEPRGGGGVGRRRRRWWRWRRAAAAGEAAVAVAAAEAQRRGRRGGAGRWCCRRGRGCGRCGRGSGRRGCLRRLLRVCRRGRLRRRPAPPPAARLARAIGAAANCIAVRAVVASSTRRSLVMMVWIPGKILNNVCDQRINVRPDCGGLQRRTIFISAMR